MKRSWWKGALLTSSMAVLAACTGGHHGSASPSSGLQVHARYVGLMRIDPFRAIPDAVPVPRACKSWVLDRTSQGSVDLVMHFLVPPAQAQTALARVRAIPGVEAASITGANSFDSAPTADPGFPPVGAGVPC